MLTCPRRDVCVYLGSGKQEEEVCVKSYARKIDSLDSGASTTTEHLVPELLVLTWNSHNHVFTGHVERIIIYVQPRRPTTWESERDKANPS